MATKHLVIGGGTAGVNAIRAIREEEPEPSEITLVTAERPYSRMVLPYFLDRSIAEAHVYTATPPVLADWGVTAHVGRRAVKLDARARICHLDDGTQLGYDTCLIATGSSAVRPPIAGADGARVFSFWTLEQARAVLEEIKPGSHVVMVGAGFISFTILNSILALGARLTIVEVAPRILPRMIDQAGAGLVDAWLQRHGVTIRAKAKLTKISDVGARKRLTFAEGGPIVADLVIMATGIKTNLEWLEGSGITVNRGIVVDEMLRSSVPNVFAAGDVAEGPDLVSGGAAVHAIEPTAQEHGRIAGANMAGRGVVYRGSLLMNIVEVCHLDIASFGAWEDTKAAVASAVRPDRPAYRKLFFTGERLTGAIILGPSSDIWTTNDIGMLKGLIQSQVELGPWKAHLVRNPFDVKPAFIAAQATRTLLPETVLGRPSKAPGNTPVAV